MLYHIISYHIRLARAERAGLLPAKQASNADGTRRFRWSLWRTSRVWRAKHRNPADHLPKCFSCPLASHGQVSSCQAGSLVGKPSVCSRMAVQAQANRALAERPETGECRRVAQQRGDGGSGRSQAASGGRPDVELHQLLACAAALALPAGAAALQRLVGTGRSGRRAGKPVRWQAGAGRLAGWRAACTPACATRTRTLLSHAFPVAVARPSLCLPAFCTLLSP